MLRGCYDRLKDELANLHRVERPKVIKDIAEARAHGDLSENAEYDAAKEKQGMVEARIRELENKIGKAHIIDPSTLPTDKVVFGLCVTVMDLATDAESTYQILSEDEADASRGKISYTSPLGRAFIGKQIGDSVIVEVPAGTREFEVVSIEKP